MKIKNTYLFWIYFPETYTHTLRAHFISAKRSCFGRDDNNIEHFFAIKLNKFGHFVSYILIKVANFNYLNELKQHTFDLFFIF